MPKLISEAILPLAGTSDPAAMSRGEPGLPAAFTWRGRTFSITVCRRTWKQLRPESGGGELYLRRHYYLLEMEDGREWTVYCLRHPPRPGGSGRGEKSDAPRVPRQRWFLYSIG